jgi:hypothetical protein
MSILLALLLTPQEPAPLPTSHKISQALADVQYQRELMEARRYKPLRIFEPVIKYKYAVVRSVQCSPAPLPAKWQNRENQPLFVFGGSAKYAAQCSYEYLWIKTNVKKSLGYKGPRQKEPQVIFGKQQKRLNKKQWQSETTLILRTEYGPCQLMSRSPPQGLDCGEYWFLEGAENFRG